MATATQPRVHSTHRTHSFGEPQYTTVTKDVAYGKKINAKGEKEAVVLDVEEATELEKAGSFEGQVVSTKVVLPANWAAVLAYENGTYKDNEGNPRDLQDVLDDLVTLMRPGFQTKATNRRNQKLLDTDSDGNFTFSDKDLTDGILDLTGEITSPSKRIFLTEEEKTWRSLANLAPAVRDITWRAYLSAIGKEYYVPESKS